jgi:hypothetical protein
MLHVEASEEEEEERQLFFDAFDKAQEQQR